MKILNWPYTLQSRSNVILRLTNSTTDLSSTNKTVIAGDTLPAVQNDYFLFTGSETIRYADSADFHSLGSYSVELEVYLESTASLTRHIASVGDSFSVSFPEWSIVQTPTSVLFNTSSNNTSVTTTQTFISNYNTKQWYRIGFMFYSGRVAGFVNDIQVFDQLCSIPYDSSNGLSIGGDFAKYIDRQFTGRIRNLTIGRSQFWVAEEPEIQNAPTWSVAPGNLGTYAEGANLSIALQATDLENNIESYQLISGSLPSGITLDTTTGVLSGTLPLVSDDTFYSFSIKVTDGTGLFVTGNFTLGVANTGSTVVWQTSNENTLIELAPDQASTVTLVAISI